VFCKDFTQKLNQALHNKTNEIRSILDLGCGEQTGDNYFNHLNLLDKAVVRVDFITGLKVPKRKRKRKNRTHISYRVRVLFKAPFSCGLILPQLPQEEDITAEANLALYANYDLVIIKDVLQHMPDKQVELVIRRLIEQHV
jgi:hypothetical protein